jgi:hypothetical protein
VRFSRRSGLGRMTPCSVVTGNQCFRGPCCLHLQPEVRGNMDIRNVSFLPEHYAASQPRRTRLIKISVSFLGSFSINEPNKLRVSPSSHIRCVAMFLRMKICIYTKQRKPRRVYWHLYMNNIHVIDLKHFVMKMWQNSNILAQH